MNGGGGVWVRTRLPRREKKKKKSYYLGPKPKTSEQCTDCPDGSASGEPGPSGAPDWGLAFTADDAVVVSCFFRGFFRTLFVGHGTDEAFTGLNSPGHPRNCSILAVSISAACAALLASERGKLGRLITDSGPGIAAHMSYISPSVGMVSLADSVEPIVDSGGTGPSGAPDSGLAFTDGVEAASALLEVATDCCLRSEGFLTGAALLMRGPLRWTVVEVSGSELDCPDGSASGGAEPSGAPDASMSNAAAEAVTRCFFLGFFPTLFVGSGAWGSLALFL